MVFVDGGNGTSVLEIVAKAWLGIETEKVCQLVLSSCGSVK
jgi:hypothetical protein